MLSSAACETSKSLKSSPHNPHLQNMLGNYPSLGELSQYRDVLSALSHTHTHTLDLFKHHNW